MSDAGTVEVYGFQTDDLEEVRAAVEAALGVTFQPFESQTAGDYYFTPFCPPHGELTLRGNLDPAFDPDTDDRDEAFAEPDFPDHGVLLYAEWTTTGHACHGKLQALGPDAELLAVETE